MDFGTPRRRAAAATLACLLVLGTATAAQAVPSPGSGPAAGGTTVLLELPVQDLSYRALAAGGTTSYAIGTDGNAYAWGTGYVLATANGPVYDPVQMAAPEGSEFHSIIAGERHAVALTDDGRAYSWGSGEWGQLGAGTATDASVPLPVQTPPGVTLSQIDSRYLHTMAVSTAGELYAWGDNRNGELGAGITAEMVNIPTLVAAPNGVKFTSVAAGNSFTLAIGSDGVTYAWGANDGGMLGDGTTTDSPGTPVRVSTPAGVTFTNIAAGRDSALATGSDGRLYAWGKNGLGQLGDGTKTMRLTPVPVSAPRGVTLTEPVAGYSVGLAHGSDGALYTWGSNIGGTLGVGSVPNSESLVPIRVATPEGLSFTHATLGNHHGLALGSDGNTYSWGTNLSGVLGDGTQETRNTPILSAFPSEKLTRARFGGASATGLTRVSPGVWTVETPAHASGTVDVELTWQLGRRDQRPELIAGGFTYLDVPGVSDPLAVEVSAGESATFSVTVSGDPAPTVAWEVSRDNGVSWSVASTDAGVTVTADGMSLSVLTTSAHNGALYRAVATNNQGSTASAAARLTVSAPVVPPVPGESGVAGGSGTGAGTTPVVHQADGDVLASTGGDAGGLLLVGGVLALLGAALVYFLGRRARV